MRGSEARSIPSSNGAQSFRDQRRARTRGTADADHRVRETPSAQLDSVKLQGLVRLAASLEIVVGPFLAFGEFLKNASVKASRREVF
jgi:hypothetical protein